MHRTPLGKYLNGLRNPEKRAYASAYCAWMEGRAFLPPKQPDTLKGMACQAVWLRLCELVISPVNP